MEPAPLHPLCPHINWRVREPSLNIYWWQNRALGNFTSYSTTVKYVIINQISHLDRGVLWLIKLFIWIDVMKSISHKQTSFQYGTYIYLKNITQSMLLYKLESTIGSSMIDLLVQFGVPSKQSTNFSVHKTTYTEWNQLMFERAVWT
jgi:hypothetical protein